MNPAKVLRGLPLSVKLPLLMVLSVLLTAGAGAGAAIVVGRHVLREAELQDCVERLAVYARAIAFYLDSARSVLETTASLPQMKSFAQAFLVGGARAGMPADVEGAARDLAGLVLEHSRAFEYIMLLRPDGSVYAIEPHALEATQSHVDLSFQPWYTDVLRTGRTVISDLVISTVTQHPVIVIATPVRAAGGRLLGIWVGALRLEELSRTGHAGEGEGPPSGYGYVTDRRGLIIAHQTKPHYVQNQTDFSSVPTVRAALERRRGSAVFVNPIEDEQKVGAFMPLPDLGWAAVYVVPTRVAFAPLTALTRGILVTAAGLAVLLGIVGAIVSRRIAGRITRLTDAARIIGTGDFSQKIEVRTGDEIERLAEEFNRMAAALSDSQSRLRAYAGELEGMVQARTETLRSLEEANRELEAFSYSVSHDLRAPLRAMDGFSRILLQKHGPALPAEGRRLLQVVRDNARQMGELVDDLLAFSHLGRQPLATSRVEPAEIVRQALEELRPQQEGRQVDISIGDLPACRADPTLLRQVFINLLDNALKFTRQRDMAYIEVGCRKVTGEDTYVVRDNGAGFDMAYADKLFGVFQRLHRAEDYEGTGVGLAIVQRIVQRHGGRVWAEAVPDRGATFFFTLRGGKSDDEPHG